MTTLLTILKSIGVLMIGLALRLAVAVLLVAAMSVPVLALYFAARWLVERWRDAVRGAEQSGLAWRPGVLHTPGHLWMEPKGDGFRVGVDGIAQRLLRGVKRVALPMAGARIRRGDPIAEIVTATRRVPIPAPVDGTVAIVNERLKSDPQKLERDSYAGWLLVLRPEAIGTLENRQGAAARDWFKNESWRLSRLFEEELGLAAADGGEPLESPEATLSAAQWERLTSAFLKVA